MVLSKTSTCFVFIILFVNSISSQLFSQNLKLDSIYSKLSEDFDEKETVLVYQSINKEIAAIHSDTLAAEYYQKFAYLRESKGYWDEVAETMHHKAYERCIKFGDPCKTVMIQFGLTRFSLFQDNPQETLERAKKALNLAKDCNELKHIAHAQSYIGAAYINLSSYKIALEYLIESEKNYEILKNSSGVAMVNLDKAIVYDELKDDEKAAECTKKAALIYKDQPDKELNYGVALVDLCSTYIKLKEFDSVQKYLPIAHNILENKHQLAMTYIYQNYGSLYNHLGDQGKAIENYKKSLALNKSINNASLDITNYSFLSDIYLNQNNPKMAYRYATIADSIARAIGDTGQRISNLPVLAKASHAMSLHNQSNNTYQEYIKLYDSIKGIERIKEISALEQAYEAEKRENIIKLQQRENDLLTEKNRASNNRNLALGILSLLVAAIAYSLVHRFRLKSQQQENQMKIHKLENAHLNRELTSKVLQIAQKNEVLQELKDNLNSLKQNSGYSKNVNELYNKLQLEKQIDENWDTFLQQFTDINPKFYKELNQQHEGLTKNDFRLAALIRMNVNSKDIASILNISPEGVKKARYRLRKKLNLSSDDNMENYLILI